MRIDYGSVDAVFLGEYFELLGNAAGRDSFTETAARVPKGGLARITSGFIEDSFSRESSQTIGLRSVPTP